MLKGQKGITLVALVVTIIVLLILAGVSISLVLGNNGVLTQASSAVTSTNIAKVKEEVGLALSSMETDYYSAWATNTGLKRDEYYNEGNMAKYLKGDVQYTIGTRLNAAGDAIDTTVTVNSTDKLAAGIKYIVEYSGVKYIVEFDVATGTELVTLKGEPKVFEE